MSEEDYYQKKIKEKRSEIDALKRELQQLNTHESDIREIFAAERTRYGAIPKYWFFIMFAHIISSFNNWYSFRAHSVGAFEGEGGGGQCLILVIAHLGMFLLYWRRFYLPHKSFTIPMSAWIFIASYFIK